MGKPGGVCAARACSSFDQQRLKEQETAREKGNVTYFEGQFGKWANIVVPHGSSLGTTLGAGR